MNGKSKRKCCFFGHRTIDFETDFYEKMKANLEDKIKENFRIFYFCMDNAFDEECYRLLKQLKTKYSDIQIIICYADEKTARKNFYRCKDDFDGYKVFPLKFDYWYTKLYYRNIAVIDECDFCFFYVERKNRSGAFKAMNYAAKIKKPLENVAPVPIGYISEL